MFELIIYLIKCWMWRSATRFWLLYKMQNKMSFIPRKRITTSPNLITQPPKENSNLDLKVHPHASEGDIHFFGLISFSKLFWFKIYIPNMHACMWCVVLQGTPTWARLQKGSVFMALRLCKKCCCSILPILCITFFFHINSSNLFVPTTVWEKLSKYILDTYFAHRS
jgi:hypothetical protein